jgi:hypothetical protein
MKPGGDEAVRRQAGRLAVELEPKRKNVLEKSPSRRVVLNMLATGAVVRIGKNPSRINCVGCMLLPAFSFVPAQRAIRFDSLAHRARKPDLMISKGPTGRPFAVKDHRSESNCRPVGPSTSGCFRFQGRWPWLFELLALWAETKYKRQKRGVVSGRVLSCHGRPLVTRHDTY